MADTFTNQKTGIEITPDIIKTSRTYSLNQAVNVALNGIVHVQCFGGVIFQLTVEFVIHEDNDQLLYDAYLNSHMVKVIDGDKEYTGYITSIELDNEFVQGYHKGQVVLQEEVL